MKRLIVFCDGTWNRADQPAPTNVCKLREAVDESEAAAVRQHVHYEPGVGTRRWERVRGGAFGVGLSRNVRDCYAFLVDRYEPGDELFVFGFSRGAFTARSLAGLVRNSGILRREHRDMVKDAYRLYRSRKPEDAPSEQAAEAFRRRYSHPDAEIAFVGVWDTVGALGIPIDGFRPPLLSRRWTFHDTTLSRFVLNAYHAISIDERRRPFVPTLWVKKVAGDGTVEEPPEHQTVCQVWFAGVHSDVGGGYPDPSLSEVPLLWIAGRARACGLVLKPDHLVVRAGSIDEDKRRNGIELAPDPRGAKHDSMSLVYRLLRPLDRELKSRDGVPINAFLASSVKVRCTQDRSYTAPGLTEWLTGGGAISEVQPQEPVTTTGSSAVSERSSPGPS
jgi:uncharacterized protein (DUF2235 family)